MRPRCAQVKREHSAASFIRLNYRLKYELMYWLPMHYPSFRQMAMRLSEAAKKLSPICVAPHLAFDMTLTQF